MGYLERDGQEHDYMVIIPSGLGLAEPGMGSLRQGEYGIVIAFPHDGDNLQLAVKLNLELAAYIVVGLERAVQRAGQQIDWEIAKAAAQVGIDDNWPAL